MAHEASEFSFSDVGMVHISLDSVNSSCRIDEELSSGACSFQIG